ncbi:hypothetical protein [Sanyastnella coralliicola]|uniref:hypothetical protein n=1 Tax=Sanyastnella coralliicola TaxID=3069118 RepID=UPI0027BAD7A0|nr:hypothetical protein [Longitalea sp. SCSIO 12813]
MKHLIFFFGAIIASHAAISQIEYNVDSPCQNFCEFLHVFNDENTVAVITENCDESISSKIYSIHQGELILEHTFEDELIVGITSYNDICRIVTSANESHHIHSFSSEIEVIHSQTLDLPVDAIVSEIISDEEYVVISYFLEFELVISRHDLESGSAQEEISFENIPSTLRPLSEIFSRPDGTVIISLDCEHKFRFDPLNLTNAVQLPLPYSEDEQIYYDPCSGLLDAFRSHPDEEIAMVSASTLIDDEFIYFSFAEDGELLSINAFDIPENHNPNDFCFDDEGNLYVVYIYDNLESGEVINDLKVIQYSAEGDIIGDLHLNIPEWEQWGHRISIHGDSLWLYGSKFLAESPDSYVTSIFSTNRDFSLSIDHPLEPAFVLINSEASLGFSPTQGKFEQKLIDLSGRVIRASDHLGIWPKSEIPRGIYILTAESVSTSFSQLVSVE